MFGRCARTTCLGPKRKALRRGLSLPNPTELHVLCVEATAQSVAHFVPKILRPKRIHEYTQQGVRVRIRRMADQSPAAQIRTVVAERAVIPRRSGYVHSHGYTLSS